MIFHSRFAKPILLLLALILGHTANSQRLNQSRQTSYYTFIYKLTDKEAAKIYKNDIIRRNAQVSKITIKGQAAKVRILKKTDGSKK